MKWFTKGKGRSRKAIPMQKPFFERVIEPRWQNSTPMPLVSVSKSPKCGIDDCPKVAVKDGMCQEHYDLESQISVDNPEERMSVLEDEDTGLGETLVEPTPLEPDHNLLDERDSERLQGAGAILGDIFKPTKPTNTPQKTKETEGEMIG